VAGSAVCDGGLMLDFGAMKRTQLDPDARAIAVEPGLTWGEFDAVTQRAGLMTPGGIVSTTGVAGLTLGGGHGWLMRRYGLTCDNLRAVNLVTADGHRVRASTDERADLFWGVRGGGGNRELGDDGFVITAFVTRRIQALLKRSRRWP
jgi:FAD/FMN-containing dehydrogenase